MALTDSDRIPIINALKEINTALDVIDETQKWIDVCQSRIRAQQLRIKSRITAIMNEVND